MAISKTIPDFFFTPHGAKDLPVGARGWFPAAVLRIDPDRRGWIDPRAEPLTSPPDPALRYKPEASGPVIEFEKVADVGGRLGFHITLHRPYVGGHEWRSEPAPSPAEAGGFEWLPAEFVVPD